MSIVHRAKCSPLFADEPNELHAPALSIWLQLNMMFCLMPLLWLAEQFYSDMKRLPYTYSLLMDWEDNVAKTFARLYVNLTRNFPKVWESFLAFFQSFCPVWVRGADLHLTLLHDAFIQIFSVLFVFSDYFFRAKVMLLKSPLVFIQFVYLICSGPDESQRWVKMFSLVVLKNLTAMTRTLILGTELSWKQIHRRRKRIRVTRCG